MEKLNYLNVGCGNRFHTSWVNLDMISKSLEVKVADLTKGIPYPDETFEVVYHSHVLEHIPRSSALFFIRECRRVLKKGATLRVVVPDLEETIRQYISQLEAAIEGDSIAARNYELIMLELYDQSLRTKSGGQLKQYLSDRNPENKEFILSRMGQEALNTWDAEEKGPRSWTEKWRSFQKWNTKNKFQFIKRKLIRKLLFGEAGRFYELGAFRNSGEIHQWMYDRYSLNLLLAEAGFKEIHVQDARSSFIPDWEKFNLDTENGRVILPNSLYMEARK